MKSILNDPQLDAILSNFPSSKGLRSIAHMYRFERAKLSRNHA